MTLLIVALMVFIYSIFIEDHEDDDFGGFAS